MDQFQCFECGMLTIDEAKIKKHMNTAHNIKVEIDIMGRKFPCSLCSFTTRNMDELKNHLMNVHNKEEHNWMVEDIKAEFTCDECDWVFSRKSELENHLSVVHSGDRGNIQQVKAVKFKETDSQKSIKNQEDVVGDIAVSPPVEKKANHWTEAQTKLSDEARIPNIEESENVVKLDYVLDEFKNMKVAKANAKKPMTIHRIETDTLNIRYELNSAVYLALKEEFDTMEKGYTWVDNDNQVKMVIEKKPQYEEDKADNNPKTVIRWKVDDEKNKFESSVTLNLYNTNQGIHFQGGRRNGKVTSCSLAASMFETWSMIMIRDKEQRIRMMKETILGMDLRRKPFLTANRLLVKPGPQPKTEFKCDLCAYKSVKETELKRHMYILHRNKTCPTITDAKKRAASPPKVERPFKKDSEEQSNTGVNETKVTSTPDDPLVDEIPFTDINVPSVTDKPEDPKDTRCLCKEDCTENCVLDEKETSSVEKAVSNNTEVTVLKKAHTEADNQHLREENEILTKENNILKLKVNSLSNDLAFERDNLKDIIKKKESVESNYQDAARTIAQMQEQVTIREEQIKVLGDLISLDKETNIQEIATEENGWTEIYEDVTEHGGLISHMEKSTVTFGCKKCDKVLKSDHELREHMKKHIQLMNKVLKCDYCNFETKDENEHINHVVDNHSPNHICDSCSAKFTIKNKLVEHIVKEHFFSYTNETRPDLTIECYDCSEKFNTKPDLVNHKKEKHYKTRLCPFYHGRGRGCNFPHNVCLNIHQENITPTENTTDFRKRINCKNGLNCTFHQRGSCMYKHQEFQANIASNRQEVQPGQSSTFGNHIRNNQHSQVNPRNILETYKCNDCHSEFSSKAECEHHTKTMHKRSEVETITYSAIAKIGLQLENIMQRLQSVESKSMTNFPSAEGAQRNI